jgi:DNA-binding LytR/AlgR family response regulator
VIRQEPIIGSQGFPTLFFNVFIVVAAVGVIRYAVIRINEDANDSAVTVQKPEPPRLLRRVPKHLRGQVLRLSARNHMVEVVTDLGKTELRLRLTDAVAEMEPVEGLMAHRSHWVAREAVETAYRADTQKVYVKLTNGDVVPISRTFRPDWIEIGALSPCTNGATLPVASVPPVAQDPSEPQLSPRA